MWERLGSHRGPVCAAAHSLGSRDQVTTVQQCLLDSRRSPRRTRPLPRNRRRAGPPVSGSVLPAAALGVSAEAGALVVAEALTEAVRLAETEAVADVGALEQNLESYAGEE